MQIQNLLCERQEENKSVIGLYIHYIGLSLMYEKKWSTSIALNFKVLKQNSISF